MWLAANNKILTWPNLQRRGWEGPNRCILCKLDNESSDHIFLHCSFTIFVWNLIYSTGNYNQKWGESCLTDSLSKWTTNKYVPTTLPPLICWFVWLERNATTFDEKTPSVHSVMIRALGTVHKPEEVITSSLLRSCLINQNIEFPVACFDGAAKENGQCCGAGGIIKLSNTLVHKWYLNCGIGSNTKAELLGAWATLHIAKLLALPKIQILGDSKVIIEWLNDRSDLRVSSLEGWKKRIRTLKNTFESTQFFHIYREFNKEADSLSKKALNEPEGYITLHLWTEGVKGQPRLLNFY
jgi:ribonuclease HI